MKPAFSVECACAEDVPELERVFASAFIVYVLKTGQRPPPMDRDYRRLIDDRFVLKLCKGAKAVGFAALLPQQGRLYIDAIAITPEHQRQGGGSLLLQSIEELASQLCLGSVQLHTPARAGPLAFYRRLGYAEVSRDGNGRNASARFEKEVDTALGQILRAPRTP